MSCDFFTEYANWTWNDDPTNIPSYFNWAEGEPNLNPDTATNYVQLQQDYNSGEDPIGTWFVPEDQDDVNYYICQSPKIPISQKTCTTPQTTFTTTDSSSTVPPEDMLCMEGYVDIVSDSGKCYYISSVYDDTLSWDDATQACNDMMNWGYNVDYNSRNTQLVSINSDDENDQLYYQLNDLSIQYAWIGLSWNGKK